MGNPAGFAPLLHIPTASSIRPAAAPPLSLPSPTLDVIDTPEIVRAFLLTFNIALSGKPKENRRRLAEYATQQNRRLVWYEANTGRIKK